MPFVFCSGLAGIAVIAAGEGCDLLRDAGLEGIGPEGLLDTNPQDPLEVEGIVGLEHEFVKLEERMHLRVQIVRLVEPVRSGHEDQAGMRWGSRLTREEGDLREARAFLERHSR